jgi:hypothetical protein
MMRRQIKCTANLGTLKHEFIWKRPILSRTVLSITLCLMDALSEMPVTSRMINISTKERLGDVTHLTFQAGSISSRPELDLNACVQDVLARGGKLTDSLADNGGLTIYLEFPHSLNSQA